MENSTSPAYRLHLVIELFTNGFLCACNTHDEIWDEDEFVYRKEIRHKPTCDGRVKAMALLSEDKNG